MRPSVCIKQEMKAGDDETYGIFSLHTLLLQPHVELGPRRRRRRRSRPESLSSPLSGPDGTKVVETVKPFNPGLLLVGVKVSQLIRSHQAAP